MLEGKKSEWIEVSSGVPQGSVLGLILFIIYINDIDENIVSRIRIFNDDTKMLGEVKTTDDRMAIKKYLNNFLEWADLWQMPFNINKCKVMHIENSNMRIGYEMKRKTLQVVEQETDLGININCNLKWEAKCRKAAKEGNQILGLIYRSFECKSKKIMLSLYKSLVRPHLDYCIQVWRPYLQKDIDIIERVQRRATRMVEGLKGVCYEERLRRLHLTTLETRRTRADLIEVYKIFHGLEGLNVEDFFELSHLSNTRGHEFKIYKRAFRTNLGKYSFGNRVIADWNSLPLQVVMTDSLLKFKILLDHHLE